MKVALCGYPPVAFKFMDKLESIDIECKYFISDLVSSHGNTDFKFPESTPQGFLITFLEFRQLMKKGKVDGVFILEDWGNPFGIEVLKKCMRYDIQNVTMLNFDNVFEEMNRLDSEKVCVTYLETNLIDSCNLNCEACTHYSNIFKDEDFYRIEDFTRDIKRISEKLEVLKFRLLGGEPLKLKNLDEYLKIARKFLPHTDLRITTNGLLIPKVSQKVLDSLRENRIVADISMYPPTVKMIDQITNVLNENKIPFTEGVHIQNFNAFLTLHGGHNPLESSRACFNESCRFLRNGKIYKCPIDALSFKFAQHFGFKGFPKATGMDLFNTKNFGLQLKKFESPIEFCTWCNETVRQIEWKPENNPKITDWLADPAEVENLLPK